jgi:hypothetical protein
VSVRCSVLLCCVLVSTLHLHIIRPSPSPPPLCRIMFYLFTTPVLSCDAPSSALSCAVVYYFALPESYLPYRATLSPTQLFSAVYCFALPCPALLLSSQPSYAMLTCPLLQPAVTTQRQVVRSCHYQNQKQD